MAKLTRAELLADNENLRRLLSDAYHQNKVDAAKIMRLKEMISCVTRKEPFRVTDPLKIRAKQLAHDFGWMTRVHNGALERRDGNHWIPVS